MDVSSVQSNVHAAAAVTPNQNRESGLVQKVLEIRTLVMLTYEQLKQLLTMATKMMRPNKQPWRLFSAREPK